jgi:hypothetical protein
MSNLKKIAMLAARKAAVETYKSIMKMADQPWEAPILKDDLGKEMGIDDAAVCKFLTDNGAPNVAETYRGANINLQTNEPVRKDVATLSGEWANVNKKVKIGIKTQTIISNSVYRQTKPPVRLAIYR